MWAHGLETVKAEVKELTRDEAVILMVESNFQRSSILPSEKAFNYKMRYDALKRQAGSRTDLTGDPMEPRLKTSEIVAKQADDSASQVKRYIHLTELILSFWKWWMKGESTFRPAVELSYLLKSNKSLLESMSYADAAAFSCTGNQDEGVLQERQTQRGCHRIHHERGKAEPKGEVHIQGGAPSPVIPSTITLIKPSSCSSADSNTRYQERRKREKSGKITGVPKKS